MSSMPICKINKRVNKGGKEKPWTNNLIICSKMKVNNVKGVLTSTLLNNKLAILGLDN